MRIGVFGNAGSWYVGDLQRAAAPLGIVCERLEFAHLTADCDAGGTRFTCGERDLADFDAFIVRTMPPGSLEQVVTRMNVLGRLEASGKLVLNPPRAVECAVDKALTTQKLAEAGLSVPATWTGETADAALEAFARLGGDVVVKPLFGSEGRGILRVSDPDLALRTFRTLERIDAVLYLQRFIDHPGFDVRAMVCDGRILGAMRRRSESDFRTNVARNGTPELCSLSPRQEDLALRAAEVIGTHIAGVDLLSDREGNDFLIELNAVPGWKAFRRATGIDVATIVLTEIHQKLGRSAPAAAARLSGEAI